MGKFYIISGDDDFARKQRVRELAAELSGSPEPETDSSVEIIPGDLPELKPEVLAARFLDALRTPPFLCERKLVWMRHHPDLEYFSAERPSAVAAELFELLAQSLPEEVAVLIDGPGLDRRKATFKAFKSAGAEIEVLNTTRASDRNFAENRRVVLEDFAKRTKKRIAGDALQYLIEVIGGDSGTLANELDKLACYVGPAPEISLPDCQAVVSRTQDALSWEYTSAVTSGNRIQALKVLGLLLAQRESGLELRMLAGLSMEYQRMLATRFSMRQLKITRVSPGTFDSLNPELKTTYPDNPLLKLHPYRAFKVCESACKLGGAELAAKLTWIRNASRALVSGGGDSRILMEQLTCRLCSR